MPDIDVLFVALGRSRFRSGFKLSAKETQYLEQKGLATILDHAQGFVAKRLADAEPVNDGRQTPARKHPVFVAQHATATCCRKCLAKWHGIPKGRALRQDEIDYIVRVIGSWLRKQNTCAGICKAAWDQREV